LGWLERYNFMRKVLITGLTGKRLNSIGPSFLEEYSKKYSGLYDLTVGINKTLLEGYKTVKIDLSDLNSLVETFKGFDVVVNLAGNSDEKTSNFNDLIEPNIIATYNVFEASRRADIKRVIMASSIHSIRGYPFGSNVGMNDSPKPLNYYGATKAFIESMCHVYSQYLSCFAIRIGAYISDEALKVACPARSNFDYILSQRDFAQLVYKAIVAPDDLKFAILAGSSNNKNNYMDIEETKRLIDYKPEDNGYAMCKPHIVGKL